MSIFVSCTSVIFAPHGILGRIQTETETDLSLSDKYVFHHFARKRFFPTQDATLVNLVGRGRRGHINILSEEILTKPHMRDGITNYKEINKKVQSNRQ